MRKAQSISINTIVVIAIALLVLVVIIAIFGNKVGIFVRGSGDCKGTFNGDGCFADCAKIGDGSVYSTISGTECEKDKKVCCKKIIDMTSTKTP